MRYETNGNRSHDWLVVPMIDIETAWIPDLGHDTPLHCRIRRRDILKMNGVNDPALTPVIFRGGVSG